MTKQHFDSFAEQFRKTYHNTCHGSAERNRVLNLICTVCEQFNPKFDRDRFITACNQQQPNQQRAGRARQTLNITSTPLYYSTQEIIDILDSASRIQTTSTWDTGTQDTTATVPLPPYQP